MKCIRLKKDAERRIKAGHLWIFSNDIDTQHNSLKNYSAGELVRIETAFGKTIAIGYINPQCLLCIRILSHELNKKIDVDFFIQRITQAQKKREHVFSEKYYRVVFGESDRLPGLVIDQYNDIVVIQINTAGMENLKSLLIDAVQTTLHPKTILLKCDSSERKIEGLSDYTEVIGEPLPDFITVKENGCEFQIPSSEGQKTGWFYDHRFNRARIATYCKNKRVLDVFSYCGAFTIPCGKNAAEITAIDRSSFALDALTQNAKQNALNNVQTICGDALTVLQNLIAQNKQFDVIILDPPALIKKKKDIPAGEKMYQKLNEAALQLLSNNGILLSASCSMHLSAADLLNCVRKAGIQTHTELSVLEHCHQGLDHPVHPAISETNYLKGFIFSAEKKQ